MKFILAIALAATIGCSSATKSKPEPVAAPDPPRITQFYATAPSLSAGEKELLCYGVANAKKVSLSPPRQELSAALSRCVEVNPAETTKYTLTAEGEGGPPASSELTVTLGPPRARIVEVTVSSLTVKPGDAVSICYHVQFVKSVAISPIGFHAGPSNRGCTMVQPKSTTTYTVSAIGPAGDKDEQPVTVKVQ